MDNQYMDAISQMNKSIKQSQTSKVGSKKESSKTQDEEVLSKRWKNLENFAHMKKDAF